MRNKYRKKQLCVYLHCLSWRIDVRGPRGRGEKNCRQGEQPNPGRTNSSLGKNGAFRVKEHRNWKSTLEEGKKKPVRISGNETGVKEEKIRDSHVRES